MAQEVVLRYKEVFDDVPLVFNRIEPLLMVGNDENCGGFMGESRNEDREIFPSGSFRG